MQAERTLPALILQIAILADERHKSYKITSAKRFISIAKNASIDSRPNAS